MQAELINTGRGAGWRVRVLGRSTETRRVVSTALLRSETDALGRKLGKVIRAKLPLLSHFRTEKD